MSTLISKANGNFTTASTWNLVDSASFLDPDTGTTTVGSSITTPGLSSAFTPAASTVDGIAVKLGLFQGTVGGQFRVTLQKSSDATILGEVTVNCADLPQSGGTASSSHGWFFFKFNASVVLDGATACKIGIGSGTESIAAWRDITASNWSRMLRTTGTQAPGSGDQLHVLGEWSGRLVNVTSATHSVVTLSSGANFDLTWTGTVSINGVSLTILSVDSTTQITLTTNAGALTGKPFTKTPNDTTSLSNSFTVTMDNTATTSFGPVVSGGPAQGVTVSKGGTWTNGTGNLNYYFKWKGVFAVFDGGTLNIGTSGTPIPSTATAVYEMDSAANVDTGLGVLEGGTLNVYGTKAFTASPSNHYSLMTLSRGGYCTTSGANVTAVSSQAQSFSGLSGAIVINGVSLTILSVTDATHLTLTTSPATNATPVRWTHAGTANVVTVADTTGWAASDTLCFASTSQTATDYESATILSVDSSTQVTLNSALAKPHLGISPTQAEVGNVTRNVKIRGISTSLQGYINISGITSIAIARYAEFYQLGSATAGKRGITMPTGITTSTCNIDFQYCAIHDFTVASSIGIDANMSVSQNCAATLNFSHLVVYNMVAQGFLHAIPSIGGGGSTGGGGWTITDNLFMGCGSTGLQINNSQTMSCTNNIVTSTLSLNGYIVSGNTSSSMIAVFQNNTAHSNISVGFEIRNTEWSASALSGLTAWRNSQTGINISEHAAASSNLTLDSYTAFGHTTSSLSIAGGVGINVTNMVSNSDTVFQTGIGFSINGASTALVVSGSFSQVSGIKTAHTADIQPQLTNSQNKPQIPQISFINCLFGPTPFNNFVALDDVSTSHVAYVSSQRHNQVAGSHRCWMEGGTVSIDSAVFHTSSPAARLAPTSASVKLASAPVGYGFKSKVANGTTFTVNAWVRKSVVGDPSGAAYNGNQPRLFVRKNVALGISADTLLTTATSANGTWELLSAITPAVTDDGMLEFYIDVDGTTGWANVGSFYTSQSADPGNLQYWLNGAPVNTDTPLGGSATYIA